MKHGINSRRKSTLKRLEKQLQSGVKNTKEGVVELNSKDINRIGNEISVLKKRIEN